MKPLGPVLDYCLALKFVLYRGGRCSGGRSYNRLASLPSSTPLGTSILDRITSSLHVEHHTSSFAAQRSSTLPPLAPLSMESLGWPFYPRRVPAAAASSPSAARAAHHLSRSADSRHRARDGTRRTPIIVVPDTQSMPPLELATQQIHYRAGEGPAVIPS